MKSFPFNPFIIFGFILFMSSCEPSSLEETEEIIEIQDPNFKYALLNTNCIDTNGDQIGNASIDINDDGNFNLQRLKL